MNCIVDFTFLGCFFIAGLHNLVAEELPGKIVGGTQANRGEFPWIVSLKHTSNHSHNCGGVIYNKNYIVTAAHCGCSNANLFEVVAGEYKLSVNDGTEQTRSVSNSKCHSEFDADTLENDIAIWRVSSPFVFNNAVKPAKLAQTGFTPAPTVTVAGWGYTSGGGSVSDILLKVDIPMDSYSNCETSYSSLGSDINPNSQLCAGAANKGSCVGDSGGPLHSDTTVCGIVSFGHPHCGNPYYPGVFTSVAYFYNWIRSNAT